MGLAPSDCGPHSELAASDPSDSGKGSLSPVFLSKSSNLLSWVELAHALTQESAAEIREMKYATLVTFGRLRKEKG